MARIIKKNEINTEEREEVKPKNQEEKKNKKISLRYKILIGLAALIVFLVFGATVVLAQTGIVKVPVFSSIFYRVPMPTRVLDVPSDYQPDPDNLKVTGSQEEGLLNFAFGEKELTYIFRRALTQKSGKFAENAQIVITPDYIEFFAYQLEPYRANLTIKIKPYMEKESLRFDLVEYKIGNFKVPVFVLKPFVGKFLKSDPKTAEAVNQIVQIKDFNLYDGRLDFIAKVEMANLLKVLSAISDSVKK